MKSKAEKALERLGRFGRLFVDYSGDPRGAIGRAAEPIEKEVFRMETIVDVDGGRWVPVNEEALKELVERYLAFKGA